MLVEPGGQVSVTVTETMISIPMQETEVTAGGVVTGYGGVVVRPLEVLVLY